MENDERTHSPSPEPKTAPAEKEEHKKTPAYVPPATKEKRQKSVFKYITILFAAAFVLMLLTFMMERRQNQQVVDSLNQSVSGLRESLSSMQSAQDIYDENMELIEQINELQAENDRLTKENQTLTDSQTQNEKSVEAMGWFWQIDEAYVLGKYSLCRSLIEEMGEELAAALPTEAVTDNGRFSPADRYQEIYDGVY